MGIKPAITGKAHFRKLASDLGQLHRLRRREEVLGIKFALECLKPGLVRSKVLLLGVLMPRAGNAVVSKERIGLVAQKDFEPLVDELDGLCRCCLSGRNVSVKRVQKITMRERSGVGCNVVDRTTIQIKLE